MKSERRLPGLLPALLLLGTFIVAVAAEYFLMIAALRAQQHRSAAAWMGYGVLYGPHIVMLIPGVRYLLMRKWITAAVLIAVGWVLAWEVLAIAGAAMWATAHLYLTG
jgi:hypothetical protein